MLDTNTNNKKKKIYIYIYNSIHAESKAVLGVLQTTCVTLARANAHNKTRVVQQTVYYAQEIVLPTACSHGKPRGHTRAFQAKQIECGTDSLLRNQNL